MDPLWNAGHPDLAYHADTCADGLYLLNASVHCPGQVTILTHFLPNSVCLQREGNGVLARNRFRHFQPHLNYVVADYSSYDTMIQIKNICNILRKEAFAPKISLMTV